MSVPSPHTHTQISDDTNKLQLTSHDPADRGSLSGSRPDEARLVETGTSSGSAVRTGSQRNQKESKDLPSEASGTNGASGQTRRSAGGSGLTCEKDQVQQEILVSADRWEPFTLEPVPLL